MRSLVAASRRDGFPAEIALVLSNDAEAPGLAWAAQQGLATLALPHRGFASRAAFDAAIQAALDDRGIDLICLAGFMRLLTPEFVDRWSGRMINVHPSLLPAFRGLDTHTRAIAAGVTLHGCTVHYVVPEVDAGPIIAQAAVPVLEGDTPEGLAARVLAEEHRIYPQALEGVASGRIRLVDGRVVGTVTGELRLGGPFQAPRPERLLAQQAEGRGVHKPALDALDPSTGSG
jgi:phosphoribosylglycinamide formyltransferase-1